MGHPDEVAAVLRPHGLGWGTRRIAAELGCGRETVQRYVAAGGWAAYGEPGRPWPQDGGGNGSSTAHSASVQALSLRETPRSLP